MELDEKLLGQINEAIRTGRAVVLEELVLAAKESAITVTTRRLGYCNPLVTQGIDRLSAAEVCYLKFVPVRDSGFAVMAPAREGEEGAVRFHRSPSGHAGTLNMRGVLLAFRVSVRGDRNLSLPFTLLETKADDGTPRTIALVHLKGPARRPRQSRKPGPGRRAGA